MTLLLPSTGTYTLLTGDNFGDGIGTFGLFIQRTNNAGNAEPIAFGETKSGAITKPAEIKNYTFEANAGDTSLFPDVFKLVEWSPDSLVRPERNPDRSVNEFSYFHCNRHDPPIALNRDIYTTDRR